MAGELFCMKRFPRVGSLAAALLLAHYLLMLGACLQSSDGKYSMAMEDTNFTDSAQCPTLGGRYLAIGIATPGMPDYFRVRSRKLGLDTMLAIDLTVDQQRRIEYVELIQNDGELEFVFHDQEGNEIRKRPSTQAARISCAREAVIIARSRAVTGEGVRANMLTHHWVRILKNGDLLVRVEIAGNSKSFIFSWQNKPEQYEAIFQRYK